MHEDSEKAVGCENPVFFIAMVMDRLTDEVRLECLWTYDITICSGSRWKKVWRGDEVKTEYMCVNERETGVAMTLQGLEVVNVDDFEYLGLTI